MVSIAYAQYITRRYIIRRLLCKFIPSNASFNQEVRIWGSAQGDKSPSHSGNIDYDKSRSQQHGLSHLFQPILINRLGDSTSNERPDHRERHSSKLETFIWYRRSMLGHSNFLVSTRRCSDMRRCSLWAGFEPRPKFVGSHQLRQHSD